MRIREAPFLGAMVTEAEPGPGLSAFELTLFLSLQVPGASSGTGKMLFRVKRDGFL